MLEAWTTTCSFLTTKLSSGQVSLTVSFETTKMETAQNLVSSLQSLPIMKECMVRFKAASTHFALTSLAQSISMLMIGERDDMKFHRFLDLPRELQLHVLSFTKLSSPGGRFWSDEPRCRGLLVSGVPRSRNRVDYLRNFWRPVPEDFEPCSWGRMEYRHKRYFCAVENAAWSPRCKCRRIPWSLFLVSKQMNTDATSILFSQNTLRFWEHPSYAMEFFELREPSVLRRIRRLEFNFSEDVIIGWSAHHSAAWRKLIEYIRDNLNVASLDICIDTIKEWERLGDELTPTEGELVFATYCDMGCTLMLLHGLHKLDLQFYHFQQLEPILELQVIGERYSSFKEDYYGSEWPDSWSLAPFSATVTGEYSPPPSKISFSEERYFKNPNVAEQ